MKTENKINNKKVVGLLLIGGSLPSLVACVSGPAAFGSCGATQPAVPPFCIAEDCSTQAQSCSGFSNYYYCTNVNYTATCSTTYYTDYINSEGEFCDVPGTPGADDAAACMTTTSIGPGC